MHYDSPKIKWWLMCFDCGYNSPKTARGREMDGCPKCGSDLSTVTEEDSLNELIRNEAEEA